VGSPLPAAAATTPSVGPSSSASPAGLHHPPILAYYYIWYTKTSWNRAKSDYPLLGRYSSDDKKVMQEHVAEAKKAGIDAFLVSWKDTQALDSRLATLTSVARAENFRLGLVYESLNFQRNPLPVATVKADLLAFTKRYAKDPVFRIFDRPVIVWSGTFKYSAADVASVRQALGSSVLLLASEKDVKGYQRLAATVDGNAYYWSSVNPQTTRNYASKLQLMGDAVHANQGLWIAPVAPGFDARQVGGTKTVERRDGATLRQEWGTALASSPDAVGLISWNEFSENSYIEPSVKYGDTSLRVLSDITGSPLPVLPQASSSDSSAGGSGGPGRVIGVGAAAAVVLVGGGVAVKVRGRRRRPKSGSGT
jgi:hypothetical protein